MSDYLHKVHELIKHSPQIYELLLDRQELHFQVGDCVALFDGSRRESRPYSLAGGTTDKFLRILFRTMPEGVVTSYLKQLSPGDEVQVSAPFGWFRPGQDQPDAPTIFIATSTGIAPFLSFVRSFPERPPQQLLYGVRYLREAIGLELLQLACPVGLAISRETLDGHHHGRVIDLLDTLQLTPQTQIYLCGLDAMIDDACAWLEARGIPVANLHREVFFYAEAAANRKR